MRARAAFLVFGCVAMGPSLAQASAPISFGFLDQLPPEPPPFPPDPAPEPDEHPRRPWELLPEVGAGSPFCRGNGWGLGLCSGAGAGTALGMGALYRISPFVAIGAGAAFAAFRVRDGGTAPYSRASWMGVLVRGYFAEHGLIDPYVEVGFGRGTADSGAGEVRVTGAGPSTMAGAGIDFWVLPYLRLGPALSYRFAWFTDVDVCDGRICSSMSVADVGAVGSYGSVSLVATLALGQDM